MAGMDRSGLWRAVIAGATGLAVAVFAASASALPAGCTQSGTAVSCPFVSTGSEQQFVVPAGVFGVDVTAVGGKGGAGATTGGTGGTGGFGAAVTAQFAVTPGQVLYVEVGAIGGSAPSSSAAGAGGFNGGGAGAADSGVAASGGGPLQHPAAVGNLHQGAGSGLQALAGHSGRKASARSAGTRWA